MSLSSDAREPDRRLLQKLYQGLFHANLLLMLYGKHVTNNPILQNIQFQMNIWSQTQVHQYSKLC